MNRSYNQHPPMRLAFATLAVLATTAVGMFIEELARNGAPAQQISATQPVLIAKVRPSR